MFYKTLFPSKYFAAADLLGQDVPVQIAKIVTEEVGQTKEIRPVLYFVGFTKGMVLNVTNAKRIVRMYGEETDGWIGKSITLYESETELQGDTVPCIRVRDKSQAGPLGVAATGAPRQLSTTEAADYDAMKAKLQADLDSLEAKRAAATNPVATPAVDATAAENERLRAELAALRAGRPNEAATG